MRTAAGLVAMSLLAGSCGGEDKPAPLCEVRTSLVDHTLWTQMPPPDDPFRSEGERCQDDRMRMEDFSGEASYTVETRGCRWGTVEQQVPFAVDAGEPLNFRLWYFSQTNFEVAEATLLVALGDEVIWSDLVPLPSDTGALIIEQIPAPRAIAAGEQMIFHVANHGTNSWNLIEVSVSRMEPCSAADGGR